MSTRPDHGRDRNGTDRNGTDRNGTDRNGTDKNGTDRNVFGEPPRTTRQSAKRQANAARPQPSVQEAAKQEMAKQEMAKQEMAKTAYGKTPPEVVLSPKEEPIASMLMTDRQQAVTELDLTSPKDLCRLRDLLAPEYDTLAARRDQLLQSARGQYVLIHGEEVRIHADLDSAMEAAYTHYPHDLFFVGRIHEQDFREYLATRGA